MACGALSGIATLDDGGPFPLDLPPSLHDGGAPVIDSDDGGVLEPDDSGLVDAGDPPIDSGLLDAADPPIPDGGGMSDGGGFLPSDGGWMVDGGDWLPDGGAIVDAASGTFDAGTPDPCPDSQHWDGNGCAGNVRACEILNGNGAQVWTNGAWGDCVRTSCDEGYREAGIGCVDDCPDDVNKTEAGTCGCGTADTDSDGDQTPDCQDTCPNDSNKTSAGVCGCGYSDEDADNDSVADCVPKLPVIWHTLGRTLTINQVQITGSALPIKIVSPGESVTLQVAGNWTDSNQDCPGCITQFYARMHSVFSLCFGQSTEGLIFNKSVTFNAPSASGIYFANLESSWEYSCLESTSTSTERNATTIATIVVQ